MTSAAPGRAWSSLTAMQREDVSVQAGGHLPGMGDVVGRNTTEVMLRTEDGRLKAMGTTSAPADPYAEAVLDEIDPATGEPTRRALLLRAQRGMDTGGPGGPAGKDVRIRRARLDETMGFQFATDRVLLAVKPRSAADRGGLGDYIGWKMVALNGSPVHKLSDCAGHMDAHELVLTMVPPLGGGPRAPDRASGGGGGGHRRRREHDDDRAYLPPGARRLDEPEGMVHESESADRRSKKEADKAAAEKAAEDARKRAAQAAAARAAGGGIPGFGQGVKRGGGFCTGCGAGGLLLRPSPLKVGLGPGLYCEGCIAAGDSGRGPGGRGKGKGIASGARRSENRPWKKNY